MSKKDTPDDDTRYLGAEHNRGRYSWKRHYTRGEHLLEEDLQAFFSAQNAPFVIQDMKRPPRDTGDIVDSVLGEIEDHIAPSLEIKQLWQQICPPEHLPQTEAIKVYDGVLYVWVKYGPLLQMLQTYQKRAIMMRLQHIAPGQFRDIRFTHKPA